MLALLPSALSGFRAEPHPVSILQQKALPMDQVSPHHALSCLSLQVLRVW